MGGARQGRRECQYAGILARLRTLHRAAQHVLATQSFFVLEALSPGWKLDAAVRIGPGITLLDHKTVNVEAEQRGSRERLPRAVGQVTTAHQSTAARAPSTTGSPNRHSATR